MPYIIKDKVSGLYYKKGKSYFTSCFVEDRQKATVFLTKNPNSVWQWRKPDGTKHVIGEQVRGYYPGRYFFPKHLEYIEIKI